MPCQDQHFHFERIFLHREYCYSTLEHRRGHSNDEKIQQIHSHVIEVWNLVPCRGEPDTQHEMTNRNLALSNMILAETTTFFPVAFLPSNGGGTASLSFVLSRIGTHWAARYASLSLSETNPFLIPAAAALIHRL